MIERPDEPPIQHRFERVHMSIDLHGVIGTKDQPLPTQTFRRFSQLSKGAWSKDHFLSIRNVTEFIHCLETMVIGSRHWSVTASISFLLKRGVERVNVPPVQPEAY